jgi:hypothetical protein
MMFTDEHRSTVWNTIRQQDLRAFRSWLSPELLADTARRADIRMGHGPLHVGNLVWLAVASALHVSKNFQDILGFTLKVLSDTEGFSATRLGRQQAKDRRDGGRKPRSKHDPRGHCATEVSEEAFTKARRIMSIGFWQTLLDVLVERFQALHGQWTRWRGFRLLALDSTNLRMPKWKSLMAYWGTLSNGKGNYVPQARLVLLQFPLVRIPYHYELTPVNEGEKTIALRLIRFLLPNDLLLFDRGFWSYRLFCQIQWRKAFFAIRQVKTAKLKPFQRLGYRDWLVRWTPQDKALRRRGYPASMLLRLIGYQIKGFRPSAVVTTVLDPKTLSRDDFVRLATTDPDHRLAPGLYHRRWEIETTFAELKVIQGLKKPLRSRTPEGIRYEVAGHLILYFLIRALIVEAAVAHGHEPLRLSFTHALQEVQDLRPALITASPCRVSRVLLPRLLKRIAEHIVPERPGRHYDRPHDTEIKIFSKGKIKLPSKLPPKPLKQKERKKHAA